MFDKLGAVETKLPYHMWKHTVNFCLKSRSFKYFVLYWYWFKRSGWWATEGRRVPETLEGKPTALHSLCGHRCQTPELFRDFVPKKSLAAGPWCCALRLTELPVTAASSHGPATNEGVEAQEALLRWSKESPSWRSRGLWLASFSCCWLCSHWCLLFFRHTESCRH